MKLILVKAEMLHNFSKTIMNILIIAIAVAVFIVFKTLVVSYKTTVEKPFEKIGANLIIQKGQDSDLRKKPEKMSGIRIPFSVSLFETNEIEQIKSLTEIKQISKSLLFWDMSKGSFKTIVGFNPEDSSIGANRILNWIAKGSFPTNTNEILLEKHFAKFAKLKIGDYFHIGNRSLKVSGLVRIKEGNQLAAANGYVLHKTAIELLEAENVFNTIYLTLNDLGKLDDVKKQIKAIIPNAKISSSNSFLETAGGLIIIADKFSLMISLITAIVAFLLITRVMLSSFSERTRDIGILKAIGWNNSEIKTNLIIEAVVQTFVGSVIGIGIGIAICWLLSSVPVDVMLAGQVPPSTATQFSLNLNDTTLEFVILPKLFVVSIIVSVLIGLTGGYLMVGRMFKIKPAEILRKL